jgi:hypothetical protein
MNPNFHIIDIDKTPRGDFEAIKPVARNTSHLESSATERNLGKINKREKQLLSREKNVK